MGKSPSHKRSGTKDQGKREQALVEQKTKGVQVSELIKIKICLVKSFEILPPWGDGLDTVLALGRGEHRYKCIT